MSLHNYKRDTKEYKPNKYQIAFVNPEIWDVYLEQQVLGNDLARIAMADYVLSYETPKSDTFQYFPMLHHLHMKFEDEVLWNIVKWLFDNVGDHSKDWLISKGKVSKDRHQDNKRFWIIAISKEKKYEALHFMMRWQ